MVKANLEIPVTIDRELSWVSIQLSMRLGKVLEFLQLSADDGMFSKDKAYKLIEECKLPIPEIPEDYLG